MTRASDSKVFASLRDPRKAGIRTAMGRVLADHVTPLTSRIRGRELDHIGTFVQDTTARGLVTALSRSLLADTNARMRMRDRLDVLQYSAAHADPTELQPVLARHLRVTARRSLARWLDQRALRRGTLDLTCLVEREDKVLEELGARIEVACEALGQLVAGQTDVHAHIETTGAYEVLLEVARGDRRRPTRLAAVRSLVQAAVAASELGELVRPRVVSLLMELATGTDPWVARAALGLEEALGVQGATWLEELVLEEVPPEGHPGERFLVRARALELLLARDAPVGMGFLERARKDPSELLRFTLATGLVGRTGVRAGRGLERSCLLSLLQEDPSLRVRCWTAASLVEAPIGGQELLRHALGAGGEVQRHALEAVAQFVADGGMLPEVVWDALEELGQDSSEAVARRALEVLTLRSLGTDPLALVAHELGELEEGEARTVSLPSEASPEELAAALLPYVQEDFGFWLKPMKGGRVRVFRGEALGTSPWRLLYELRHPTPSKRQGHIHTTARVDLGPLRVPPRRLDEMSPTGIPAQRVHSRRQESWVPALPLPDAYLHATRRGRITIVSAEGTTTVDAPDGWAARARAWLQLTLRMEEYDGLRRESLDSARPDRRRAYVAALRELGFHTALVPGRGRAPAEGLMGAAVDPLTYLLGLGTNTSRHLLLVVGLLLVAFYARAAFHLRKLRRNRRAIPLVIGGWGTRGKSGTERLKMGLLAGLGIPTLTKTTGCEAMVLHNPPGRPTEDLFLFRPYDKATIWEQLDVVDLARRLEARVLLWECMALRPNYVDLLQHRWVQDDLSTITNAYADHEDVMGPTGLDVARTISSFTPDQALVLTTAGPMRALVEQEAYRRGTSFRTPALHEQEFVPADLMARFPYRAHPSNISLAAGVAEALGVHRVEAIGIMAEHVVPDLGALVVYPPLPAEGRTLTFVNGMSANDGISFGHSWSTSGMPEHGRTKALEWRLTVVNNRADRVARSQVFARLLVRDAPAHRHVLIGTNLEGLRTWIRQEAQEWVELLPEGADEEQRREFMEPLCLVDPAMLCRELAAVHGAPAGAAEAVVMALAEAGLAPLHLDGIERLPGALVDRIAELEDQCGAPGVADSVAEAVRRHAVAGAAVAEGVEATRTAWRELFEASLVVVEDALATGDQIMATCARAAPPGAAVRVFGCQNIKGTGLDFAWQWVWWRQVSLSLDLLTQPEGPARAAAFSRLEATTTRSVSVCEAAMAALPSLFEDRELGARARRLEQRLAARRVEVLATRGQVRRGGVLAGLLGFLERLVDPFDAILRRHRARRLFASLAAGRISHATARDELKALTSRQKGGWLTGGKAKGRIAAGEPVALG